MLCPLDAQCLPPPSFARSALLYVVYPLHCTVAFGTGCRSRGMSSGMNCCPVLCGMGLFQLGMIPTVSQRCWLSLARLPGCPPSCFSYPRYGRPLVNMTTTSHLLERQVAHKRLSGSSDLRSCICAWRLRSKPLCYMTNIVLPLQPSGHNGQSPRAQSRHERSALYRTLGWSCISVSCCSVAIELGSPLGVNVVVVLC